MLMSTHDVDSLFTNVPLDKLLRYVLANYLNLVNRVQALAHNNF